MKRFLTISMMLALLVWAVPVSAIKVEGEKTEKKDPPAEEPKPADEQAGEQVGEQAGQQAGEKAQSGETPAAKSETAPAAAEKPHGSLLERLRRSITESKKDETPKYDQFRDANNDGVSDNVPKPASEGAANPSPAVKSIPPERIEKYKPKSAETSSAKKKTPETTTTKKKTVEPTTTKKKP
jgi:hypothetical protein